MRKLVRSVVFSPADRLSAMNKAIYSLDADVVVFDLEDAVGPTFKVKARENVIEILKTGAFDRCSVVVRVNCPVTTPWGRDDIDAISFSQSLRAILLPKVEDESAVNVALEVLQKRSIKSMTLLLMRQVNIETSYSIAMSRQCFNVMQFNN
jgi:citrate lyase subunit beta / citryl-CoA lyase